MQFFAIEDPYDLIPVGRSEMIGGDFAWNYKFDSSSVIHRHHLVDSSRRE
jgi:hypothetical protein